MNRRIFRVLIADDMQANRALLRAYLGRLDFETLMAEDGEQAVAMFFEHMPDIVLMDLMMPKVDGFEAIKRIRAAKVDHWVPVVIVSAMDAEYDVVRGLEAGADDYLSKPLSYQVFAAKMRNLQRTLEFQAARKEAMQREAAVVEAMADGILTFDEHFHVLEANRAACDVFVADHHELAQRDIRMLLADEHRSAFQMAFQSYLAGLRGEFVGHQHELYGLRSDATPFPMELCVTELPIISGARVFIATIRDISQRKEVERQLVDNAARLQQYHDEAEAEAELAKDIMERHIRRDALNQSGVQTFIDPTQRFSGDIVLAARSASGRLYAMLADATGHGLAAAMSGMTIANDFYRAVEEESALDSMIVEINNSLRALLPIGRFVSAALVCVDPATGQGAVWVGGVPDVYLLDQSGRVAKRYISSQLPLGVVRLELSEVVVSELDACPGGQLMLYSDGVIEATSPEGAAFEQEGVERALLGVPMGERMFSVREALYVHLGGTAAHDDISIMIIDTGG